MRVIKKTTIKDDGRALIYYHFPETASASQKQAFDGVKSDMIEVEVNARAQVSDQKTSDASV